MNLRIAYILAITSLLLASACAPQENLCATGNRLSVVRAELKDALIEELRREGVPVEVSELGEVCYPPDKADFVRGRLIALDLQQRPSNHITIAGGPFADRVRERLSIAGIRYTEKHMDAEVLLIIEDAEKVDAASEIIDDTARSMFGSKD